MKEEKMNANVNGRVLSQEENNVMKHLFTDEELEEICRWVEERPPFEEFKFNYGDNAYKLTLAHEDRHLLVAAWIGKTFDEFQTYSESEVYGLGVMLALAGLDSIDIVADYNDDYTHEINLSYDEVNEMCDGWYTTTDAEGNVIMANEVPEEILVVDEERGSIITNLMDLLDYLVELDGDFYICHYDEIKKKKEA